MVKNSSDTAWKEIFDAYLEDFFEYCLPKLHALIDWKKQPVPLDKELQAITKQTQTGRRLLDKLFKVYLKNGREQWVLIHIEAQGKPEKNFAKRMFTYQYRIYDRYQKAVLSCAILTDSNMNWRPCSFEIGIEGSYLRSEFLTIKLLDYKKQKSELDQSKNPFASVILAQLAALDLQSKPADQRKQVKFALTKRLYDKGFTKTNIIHLYTFIDWLIGLEEKFELDYSNEVYQLERRNKMSYISFAVRRGMEKGMEKGLEKGLEKGIKKGIEKGIEKGKLYVAQHLINTGMNPTSIRKVTQLPLAKINALKKTKH